MKFRKRPVVIEARQWDGTWDEKTDPHWFTTARARGAIRVQSMREDAPLLIETLEGRMTAQTGDWIICGVKGELYPCKPDIFAATYERVEDKP